MASMFFTHFLVLHVVQNIFAELTRFADRQFYQVRHLSKMFSYVVGLVELAYVFRVLPQVEWCRA